jgi:hypothetical protein
VEYSNFEVPLMKKPKYSDRLIFGLMLGGFVFGAIGWPMEKGMLQDIFFGIGGLFFGTAWLFTMLNAAYRHVKDDEL